MMPLESVANGLVGNSQIVFPPYVVVGMLSTFAMRMENDRFNTGEGRCVGKHIIRHLTKPDMLYLPGRIFAPGHLWFSFRF